MLCDLKYRHIDLNNDSVLGIHGKVFLIKINTIVRKLRPIVYRLFPLTYKPNTKIDP